MLSAIERTQADRTATIALGAAVSDTVVMKGSAGGGFITPPALTAGTLIGFKVSHDGVTFVPLKNSANALAQITVDLAASNGYPLPDELYGFPFFQIWTATAAGADVAQGAARVIRVCLRG